MKASARAHEVGGMVTEDLVDESTSAVMTIRATDVTLRSPRGEVSAPHLRVMRGLDRRVDALQSGRRLTTTTDGDEAFRVGRELARSFLHGPVATALDALVGGAERDGRR